MNVFRMIFMKWLILISSLLLSDHPAADDICPICLENLGSENAQMLCCGHSFCRTCLTECLQHKGFCPMCKKPVRFHMERYNKEPHDLCTNITLNQMAAANLDDVEQLLSDDNTSLDDLVMVALAFNLAVSYMPPMSPDAEIQVDSIRHRLAHEIHQREQGQIATGNCVHELHQRLQGQRERQQRLGYFVMGFSVIVCILSLFLFLVLNQASF